MAKTNGARLRSILLSAVVGVGISYVMNFGAIRGLDPRVLLAGAIIGIAIGAMIELSEAMTQSALRTMTHKRRALVRALIFFGGGVTGFFVGYTAYVLLATGHWPDFSFRGTLFLHAVAVTGPAALLVGFLATSFEQMKEKLRDSVGQLKEAEFAQKELELARAIQRRLLPPEQLSGSGYRISARNVAARYVAGDFYDVFELGDEQLGVVVGDVAGKGIAASLIMATVKAMLPLIATGRNAEQTLRELNRRLVPELSSREFVAIVYLRFDMRRGTFELCNAGMPDPYTLAAGRVTPLLVPGPRLPLGAWDGVAYETLRGELRVGQQILFVSDGLPEAQSSPGEPLGYEAFAELAGFEPTAPEAYLDDLFARLKLRTASIQDDDWTALVLRREAVPTIEAVSA